MYRKILLTVSALMITESAQGKVNSCYSKRRVNAALYAGGGARFQGSKAKEIETKYTGKLANITLPVNSTQEFDFEQNGKAGYFFGRLGAFAVMPISSSFKAGIDVFGDIGKRKSYFNNVHELVKGKSPEVVPAPDPDPNPNNTPQAIPVTQATGDIGSDKGESLLRMTHMFSVYTGLRMHYSFSDSMDAHIGLGGMISDAKYRIESFGSTKYTETSRKYEFGGYLKAGILWTFANKFFVAGDIIGQMRANKKIDINAFTIADKTEAHNLKFKRAGMFGVNGSITAGIHLIK
ncbi:hypothetical protein [Candidatus Cytomitobacter primus]|uniref:Uncharacterized protein n=1 Tax=Candidatus Cytomitobacter primus TaxID=2066024 RepID=A0A5C0UF76_9PROT|nr:hypothetical protein [Candidatus Cytomitobacter primus]QEK38429.1 hypothetical protein FZC34_00650 [Candidatus Cytomitobacter primus]